MPMVSGDLRTDLEMEPRDFVLQECSKREAAFTAGENMFL